MDADFWHQRWKENSIAFHQNAANPVFVDYIDTVSLEKKGRVFVPLCGKTLDIAWLLSRGYRVVGAELSEIAIKQLFTGLKVEPRVTMTGKIAHYCADNIDVFVGDFFDLTKEVLGLVDAVYDRAAYVALPQDLRGKYGEHLCAVTDAAPQLLVTYNYDQSLLQGPPFSIGEEEIYRNYKDHYTISPLASLDVAGGLKGKCVAKENVWLLRPAV